MSRFKPSLSAHGLILNAYGMRVDRIDQIYNLPEGVELYNTPTSDFLDTCRSILSKVRSNQVKTRLESDITNDFDLPKWPALASALTAVDNFKPEDADAHSKLKQVITMSADALIKVSRMAESKTEERRLIILDIIRMDKKSGGTFDNGTMFTRLAWGVIGKHLLLLGHMVG
jgi:hypothetical protein